MHGRDYAWGQDELLPLTKRGGHWFDLGLTLVDGLDTLLLMHLDAEFEDARTWVSQMRLDPDIAVRQLCCFAIWAHGAATCLRGVTQRLAPR